MTLKSNLLTFGILFTSILYAQDTIYYDAKWKETTKGKHSFYRPIPLKKVGDLIYLKDYYKSGALQFQGYVASDDENKYFGDVYWYHEDGDISTFQQCYNSSKTKELTYENLDGSIWQKISYHTNGRKSKISTYLNNKELSIAEIKEDGTLSGDFNKNIPDFYYKSTIEENSPGPVTILSPSISNNTIENVKKEEIKNTFFVTVFWDNGKIAKQSKYNYKPYSNQLLEQTFYDKNGKYINTIHYKNEIINTTSGKQFEYHFVNNFAQSIKTEKNIDENSTTKHFDKSGNLTALETNLKDNYSKIDFYENGKITSTQKFLYSNPYDGKFRENQGNFYTVYTLKNGKRDGEITTFYTKNDSIFTKGEYQNRLKNGYFYDLGNKRMRLQFKDGKQNGLQIIYENYYDETPLEEFEMKDGKREGLRKQYEDGKLMYESFYKNGEIFNGTALNKDELVVYKDGELETRIDFYDSNRKTLKIKETYTNGVIASIEYYNFTILNQEAKSYKGIYKDGKPFDGYFAEQIVIENIPLINYYEKGGLKHQYSFELLDQLDNYRHYTYNLKADFRDGKIYNGSEYLPATGNGMIKIERKNGSIESFDFNSFGRHYFNRISASKEGNDLKIKDLQTEISLKIISQNDQTIAEFYKGNDFIKASKKPTEVKEGSPNSISIYYLQDQKIKVFSYEIPQERSEKDGTGHFFELMYATFPKNNQSYTIDDLLSLVKNYYEKGIVENDYNLTPESIFPFEEDEGLTQLSFDSNGNPDIGIRIKQISKGFIAEGIEDGKVKLTHKFKSIENLENDIYYIAEDFMIKLRNHY